MSVRSKRTKSSHLSSILRTTSLQKSINTVQKVQPKVRFKLPFGTNISSIIRDYLEKKDVREYENLVLLVRDSEMFDEDLNMLLKETTECIPVLNVDCKLLIEALLNISWTNRSASVSSEYQTFLINLLSAHNYHAKLVIDKLVQYFIPDPKEANWPGGAPLESDCVKYIAVHWIFKVLLEVIPMTKDILLQSLTYNFPYLNKSSHIHEVYVHNMLWILDYQPKLRPEIFGLIFSKMLLLDVNAPRENIILKENQDEEIFEMDESISQERQMKHPVAETLDICLDKLLQYMVLQCHNIESQELLWDKTKSLYHDLLGVFDQIILPTYNTHHVQFVIFLLCSFKTCISEVFLNYLWKKVCSHSVATVLRQSAAAYISSFLARASFVPLTMLKGTLQEMATWIHSYIASQDGHEFINVNLRVHHVFYSVCQALFYVIAFRQKDLVNTRKNITFLESLNLGKIVTSKLNPLRVCQPAIAQNFAAVTRTYQLAYCYTIMEHNSRNTIPTIYQDDKGKIITMDNYVVALFPFDPIVLKRTAEKLSPLYLNYQATSDNATPQISEKREIEEDDFLCDQPSSSQAEMFSYGCSPGFKN